MLLARAGDQSSFTLLVERYLERVVNYCTKFTADAGAGEELAQDVFLRLWAWRTRYRCKRSHPGRCGADAFRRVLISSIDGLRRVRQIFGLCN
jgi:DNA-directed RNA polymerase specialized sigma24 family protein